MEDLRELMLTGRKAVTECGKEYLVVRDIHSKIYGFQKWGLVSEDGFMCGSDYDSELKCSNGWNKIVAIYQGDEDDKSQLTSMMLDLSRKNHLVWEREWKPKLSEKYWEIDFRKLDLIDEHTYAETQGQKRLIARGLVFKTKEEAIELAEKMLKVAKECKNGR